MNMPARTDIITYRGHYFSFENVEDNAVSILDIAHGLSNVCRFAGQSPRFYSVAQHSVLVMRILAQHHSVTDRRMLLEGLMHDATEAFMGDMPTPLKRIMPAYMTLETRVHRHIMTKLGVNLEISPIVKLADAQALGLEKRDIMRNTDPWKALMGISVPKTMLIGMAYSPAEAEEEFLDAYKRLTQ